MDWNNIIRMLIKDFGTTNTTINILLNYMKMNITSVNGFLLDYTNLSSITKAGVLCLGHACGQISMYHPIIIIVHQISLYIII